MRDGEAQLSKSFQALPQSTPNCRVSYEPFRWCLGPTQEPTFPKMARNQSESRVSERTVGMTAPWAWVAWQAVTWEAACTALGPDLVAQELACLVGVP
jgi:hypothetical protein